MDAGRPRSLRGTGSLRKALRLLSELAEGKQQGLRLTELVGRTRLDPATAHRMLACLVEENFLQKQPDKRYRLGRRVFELGLIAGRAFTEHVHAHDPLRRLSETVGATAMLSVRSGEETVYLDCVQGPEPFQGLRTEIGTRLPIGIGAGGVALLAEMDPDEADTLLRVNVPRYRAFGRDVPSVLRRRIEQARRQGFSATRSFLRPDLRAMGVAIRAAAGGFAIGIVGDEACLSDMDDLASKLRAAADEVSAAVAMARSGPFPAARWSEKLLKRHPLRLPKRGETF